MGSKYKIQLGKALKREYADFIPALGHLKTIKVHGREYNFIDKPVTPLKLSFFKSVMFMVLAVLYKEQAYASHPGSVNSARISLRQIADRAGHNKKTVKDVLDRMIEIGLVKVLVKGVKSVGGAVYLITEPLDNLLNQLPDDVLNSLGFTDKQKVRVTKDFRDKPLNDKEKESENIENSPLEEVKPQSDQGVSPTPDDQEIEEETEPPQEEEPQAAKVTPCWGAGANWTPDDDEEEDEPYAAVTPDPEPKQTDWDALLAEMGIPFGEPEPVKVTPGAMHQSQAVKVTTEWDDNVPF
ncbi:TPA: winged helix-turn-helix domain-containing protein [Escherichia coli]|nr:winged helix-turn-helix domain-containing protein [Escherichia coli]HDV2557634.1 winged helix-turn-helix domain-containing protein [Escherichia coli]